MLCRHNILFPYRKQSRLISPDRSAIRDREISWNLRTMRDFSPLAVLFSWMRRDRVFRVDSAGACCFERRFVNEKRRRGKKATHRYEIVEQSHLLSRDGRTLCVCGRMRGEGEGGATFYILDERKRKYTDEKAICAAAAARFKYNLRLILRKDISGHAVTTAMPWNLRSTRICERFN